jgi:hypothetical protein
MASRPGAAHEPASTVTAAYTDFLLAATMGHPGAVQLGLLREAADRGLCPRELVRGVIAACGQFLLAATMGQDRAVGAAAVLPCFWLYAQVGATLPDVDRPGGHPGAVQLGLLREAADRGLCPRELVRGVIAAATMGQDRAVGAAAVLPCFWLYAQVGATLPDVEPDGAGGLVSSSRPGGHPGAVQLGLLREAADRGLCPRELGAAAVLPCFWLYAQVGATLPDVEPHHPYAAWLETTRR